MKLQILKEKIKTPAENNLNWEIPALDQDTGNPYQFQVFVDDLERWVRSVMGRYLRHAGSDKRALEDLIENSETVEPKLTMELTKFAGRN